MKNLGTPGRVDARIWQDLEQRLPVAPQDAVFSRNQRQAKRLGFLAAQRLEHHGSLRFKARHRHLADERSRAVKQAACRARFGAIDAPLPGRPGETVRIRRRWPVVTAFPEHRGGTAPGFSTGLVAARQSKRPETREASPRPGTTEECLATPQASVSPQADAVPGEHEPVTRSVELRRHGAGVRFMMPGQLERQALLARPAMGRVPGMGIAHYPLCLHRVERLQILGNLREHVEASRAIHLTDVGRDDDAPTPAQGDRAFHVPANGQGRSRLLPRQR